MDQAPSEAAKAWFAMEAFSDQQSAMHQNHSIFVIRTTVTEHIMYRSVGSSSAIPAKIYFDPYVCQGQHPPHAIETG